MIPDITFKMTLCSKSKLFGCTSKYHCQSQNLSLTFSETLHLGFYLQQTKQTNKFPLLLFHPLYFQFISE